MWLHLCGDRPEAKSKGRDPSRLPSWGQPEIGVAATWHWHATAHIANPTKIGRHTKMRYIGESEDVGTVHIACTTLVIAFTLPACCGKASLKAALLCAAVTGIGLIPSLTGSAPRRDSLKAALHSLRVVPPPPRDMHQAGKKLGGLSCGWAHASATKTTSTQ